MTGPEHWCPCLKRLVVTCDCPKPVTKPDVMEDDMDDRTNLDEFLEKSRAAVVAVRGTKKRKRK